MEPEREGYEKGEIVPAPGTYRCTGCGEIWTADQSGVRFPPCDDDKTGSARWIPERGTAAS